MALLIQEVSSVDMPMDLLLIADPSEDRVRSCLSRSKCFVASNDGGVVGACVVEPLGENDYELMSVAVFPEYQRSGYGTALLKWVIEFFRKSGARQLRVGTGTFGYQLSFYQKQGFLVLGIDRDFFVQNYPEPVFENGVQHFDMVRLALRYSEEGDKSV